MTGEEPATLDSLAAALAEVGRLREAAGVAARATRLARTAGDDDLAARIESHAASYRAGRPYREAEPPGT